MSTDDCGKEGNGMKFVSVITTICLALTTGVVGYGQLKAEVGNLKEDIADLEEISTTATVNSVDIENLEESVDDVKETVHEIQVEQMSQARSMERIATTLDIMHQDIRNGNGH